MSDAVADKSLRDTANGIIADASWGKIEKNGSSEPVWKLFGDEPSVERPSEDLISYTEFLEEILPGKDNKKNRASVKSTFTDDGQPGAVFRSHCDEFTASLKLPEAVIDTDAARGAGLHGEEFFIIPAFFELMLQLKQTGTSFSIVFRTFGTDLENVAVEVNAFCEGRHPLYPDAVFDGRDGGVDYRINFEDGSRFGTFFRGDASADQVAIVFGTLQQGEFEDGLSFYEDKIAFPNIRIFSGDFQAVYDEWTSLAETPGTLAFRDYWPLWHQLGMGRKSPNGGKLMIIDTRVTGTSHCIFFDDNICSSNATIVDVREARSPDKPMWIQYLLPCHLVRAEPLEAVTDREYFVRHVRKLSKAYDKRLRVLTQLCSRLKVKSHTVEMPALLEAARRMNEIPESNHWQPARIPDWRHSRVITNEEIMPADHTESCDADKEAEHDNHPGTRQEPPGLYDYITGRLLRNLFCCASRPTDNASSDRGLAPDPKYRTRLANSRS